MKKHLPTVPKLLLVVTGLLLGAGVGVGQTISAISLAPATVNGGSGSAGTVTLTGAAPSGGLVVNLTSQVSGYVAIPASISIPAGSQSGSFAITTKPFRSNYSSLISATYSKTTRQETLSVLGESISALSLTPAKVVGGMPSTGTISLTEPAPDGGWTVNLTSQIPAYVGVPTSVTVPAGSKSTTFPISTVLYYRTYTNTIEAADSISTIKDTLTVSDNQIVGLSFSPSTVYGASGSSGKLTLAEPALAGGLEVDLTSQRPTYVGVPSKVTIAAGSTTASFSLTTKGYTSSFNTFISAAAGDTDFSSYLTVLPPTSGYWSKFRGDIRNTASTDRSGESPTTGATKWSFNTQSISWSGAVISPSGIVYTGGSNSLFAINPDGTQKWEFITDGLIQGTPAIGPDGTVYAGSEDSHLYALNPNGTIKWSFKTGGQIQSSPSVDADGTIYVASYDGFLYALNPAGTKKWAYNTNGAIFASPAIGSDGTIYLGTDRLIAVSSTGQLKWAFQPTQSDYQTPALASDGTIYVTSDDGNLYAVTPAGVQKWSYQLSGSSIGIVCSSPAVGLDGTVYVGTLGSQLIALTSTGTLKWAFSTGYIAQSSPAVGYDGTVYIGSMNNFFAVTANGTEKWSFSGINSPSSPAIGPDGTVYVAGSNNFMYAFK